MDLKFFARHLGGNILCCFRGRNLAYQLIAALLTYVIVVSGFDQTYALFFRNTGLYSALLSAGVIGFIVPVLLPIALVVWGMVAHRKQIRYIGYAIAEAEGIALFLSSFYKIFTGRAHPELFGNGLVDISREFHFGLFQGGIFWGWPSSHAAVAFSMGALVFLLCRRKSLRYGALVYAFLIGLGASATFHWFSDVVAGAIIGSVIGSAVALSFKHLVVDEAPPSTS